MFFYRSNIINTLEEGFPSGNTFGMWYFFWQISEFVPLFTIVFVFSFHAFSSVSCFQLHPQDGKEIQPCFWHPPRQRNYFQCLLFLPFRVIISRPTSKGLLSNFLLFRKSFSSFVIDSPECKSFGIQLLGRDHILSTVHTMFPRII